MWKRSEVESLTGLSRHAIQDLCNQNTARDGLGFWVPAVSKPGFSRFDEGDLLAFYLVKQLTKAGFTLAEVEPVVFGMLEDDASFEQALHGKEQRLVAQRVEVEAKLAALAQLEDAVPVSPEKRLYAIMGETLTTNAREALRLALDADSVDAGEQALIEARIQTFAASLLAVIQGEFPCFWSRASAGGDEADGQPTRLQRTAVQLATVMAEERPEASAAQALVADMLHGLSGSPEASRRNACSPSGACSASDMLVRAQEVLTARALAIFCAIPENGVPIELVFGNGSFAYLAQATRAFADALAIEG